MVDKYSDWSDEKIALLSQLWLDGKSASQIAFALSRSGGSISRNAVISKIHRLGIAGRVNGHQRSPQRPAVTFNPPIRQITADNTVNALTEVARKAGAALAVPFDRGNRFGRLVVETIVRRDDAGRAYVNFRCDCGRVKEIRADRVRSGQTKSCGCDTALRPARPAAAPTASSGAPKLPVVMAPTSPRVTLAELKRTGMCKWPLGDPCSEEFRYCGSPSPVGKSYCAHHSKLSYVPAYARRRDRDRAPVRTPFRLLPPGA